MRQIFMKNLNVKNRCLWMLLAVAALTTGCQEKKQSTVIIAPKPEAPKPTGPTVMSDMNSSNSVDWIGKTYSVVVSRKVDRDLPMVEVEPGKKAYDNRITLHAENHTSGRNGVFQPYIHEGCLRKLFRREYQEERCAPRYRTGPRRR